MSNSGSLYLFSVLNVCILSMCKFHVFLKNSPRNKIQKTGKALL